MGFFNFVNCSVARTEHNNLLPQVKISNVEGKLVSSCERQKECFQSMDLWTYVQWNLPITEQQGTGSFPLQGVSF